MRSIACAAVLTILLSGCDGSPVQLQEPVESTAQEPIFGAALGAPNEVGNWGEVLPWPHVAVSMAHLPDGRILSYSGSERRTWPTTEQTYSATWDPVTGEFVENLHRGHNMFCAALTSTADGKVLVNGGRNQGNSPWTTLFDYRNDDWQSVDNMASGGRWYPTTLSMANGSVFTGMGIATNTRNPDLWHPEQGWDVLNGIDFLDMRQRNNDRGRENVFPLLSLAPNGNVYHYWDTVENQMISPQGSGRVRRANPVTDGENHAGGVQLMYEAGKLLISGRNDGSWGGNATGAASNAFTVDLNGPVPDIRATTPMQHRRKYHQLIPMPNGEVLVIGGNTTGAKFRDDGSVMEPELWNPETGQWRGLANMSVPRDYHSTALLLPDARVIAAGGGYGGGDHQDAQIFSPPYLFDDNGNLARRPTVQSAETEIDVGQRFVVDTTGQIESFGFVRMSATTHAINTDSRFYKPEFERIGTNQWTVDVHQNPNVALPGYWMLFAIDDKGVPSEAQIIRVTAVDTRLDNLALGATASQSSTFSSNLNFAADNAIDGDLSGDSRAESLSHTDATTEAWWQVDLGRSVDIDTIRLWNRTDCCAERLANVHVMVSSTPFVSNSLAASLAMNGVSDYPINGVAGRQTDLSIGRTGRYVRVQLEGNQVLQLAEVQIFGSKREDLTNIALDGTASQSSVYQNAARHQAVAAINGNTAGDVSAVTEALGGFGGGPFSLECPGDQVLVGMNGTTGTYLNSVGARCVAVDQQGNWIGAPQDAGRNSNAAGTPFTRTCESGSVVTGFSGRSDLYVNQVTLNCQKIGPERLVFGPITALQAVGADTGTARGPYNCGGSAATGIAGRSGSWMDRYALQCDADTAGTIVHTNNDNNAWWELDLGQVMDLDSIKVWNRTDCCSDRLADFYVLVSDTPFVSKNLNNSLSQTGVFSKRFNGPAGRTTESVIGRSGRYVRVQLSGSNFLQLAEVEVLGAPLPVPLTVEPIVPEPQVSTGQLAVSATASGNGALQYSWNFGDGSSDTSFSNDPSATHRYSEPGRYVVSLTVRDASGDEIRETFVQVIHAPLTTTAPVASSSLLEIPARQQLWNLNPDNNSVTVTDTVTLAVLAEIETGAGPASIVLAPNGQVWVSNRNGASISVIDPASLTPASTIPLPRASQPYGMVADDSVVYVALEALGQVARIRTNGSIDLQREVGSSPRHLSMDAARQTLYVSRFITPTLPGEDSGNPVVSDASRQYGGEVLVMGAADLSIQDTIILQHIDREASEHEGPGVPNYLGAAVISPSGGQAWVPSKQDNILGGQLRGGAGITFDQTVRAVTSLIDLDNNAEVLSSRVDHDNASVAGHAAFGPYGVTLFVALEGNRQISIIDTGTAIEIGRFDTGRAPQGLLVSEDGSRLYVHNFMDRSVGIYDIADIVARGGSSANELATINSVANERLQPQVLRGKQLFYDARDDRLANLDYMSCASCHTDGEHDGRTWDFTSLGEGLRNTITLQGRAGMGHGMLHWSSNFDELQDFEGQIREFAGGTGLMDDLSFVETSDPLGAAKTGRSEDLDALAAYMTSLDRVPDSPWRAADGSFTADALAGQALFASSGCASCHSGEIYTDSNSAVLHDIGSIMDSSGTRLGAALAGIDTPSLLGIWHTGPYLHDGSALTVQDAIAAHLDLTFTSGELDQLAAYLLQLDHSNNEVIVPPPVESPPSSQVPSNSVPNNLVIADGSLTEWQGLTSFGADPDDTDDDNPIDWREAWMAHDSGNFHIAWRADADVQPSWGYGIYIDTDGDATTGFAGFYGEFPIGADYLIEYGDVQKYTGSGSNWSWQSIGQAVIGSSGAQTELSVARSLLGDPASVRLFFRGDNGARGGSAVDWYPDGVTDNAAAEDTRYLIYTVLSSNGNAAPVANDQAVAVASNGAIAITLSASDINADPLAYEILDLPANGSLSGQPPALIYTPAADFAGADRFTFSVSDGSADSNLATVSINVQGQVPSNRASIALDGNLNDWNALQSFGVDPADATGVNDQIDWREVWLAHDDSNVFIAYRHHNSIVPSWGAAIYIDADNDRTTGFRGFGDEYPLGADYVIEDVYLLGYTGTGTNWSWSELGALPAATSGDVRELSLARAQLGNTQALRLFMLGDNTAVGGGTFDFYPDDVTTANSAVRAFDYALDPSAVNAPPIAIGQTVTVNSGVTSQVTLSGSDPEGASLSYEITRQPGNGTLSGQAPFVVYTAFDQFSGADSFAFRVSDGNADSDPATVSIIVNGEVSSVSQASNPVANITIDGSLEDWNGLAPFHTDPADANGLNSSIDWRQVWMAHDSDNFYIAWQTELPVGQISWGHAVYLDTDRDASTGFRGFFSEYAVGADYLLEGSELFRYTGSGQVWQWEYVASLQHSVVGDIAEIVLPRDRLNTAVFDFFLQGDSAAVNGTSVDWYPNAAIDIGADLSDRRFSYSAP